MTEALCKKDETIKFKPNKKQQDCINNIYGKYLVLAGPGTGKTYTIIERIKNMLQQGIDAEKILCLTFTDAAAGEMKKRIENELNVISCGVNIFTYHGFCSSIIDAHQEEFEIPANYRVITDPVSKALIKECIDEIQPVYLRTDKNDPYFFINKIKNNIATIKQNRLTKEDYFKNIKENPDWEPEIQRLERVIKEAQEKGRSTKTNEGKLENAIKKINRAKEIWDFYELYREKMDKARYIDFNDMINMCLEKFVTNPALLHKIANEYEYLMVDEYQDTNKSQNEIVFALTNALESQNVFVVGDDDQIIYRFQGAKLDTIENFLTTFKDTQIICLTDNMRSTQSILNVARAVIAKDPLSLVNTTNFTDKDGNAVNKNIISVNTDLLKKETPVRFYKYADIMQEYTEIVNEIEDLIKSDDCPVNKNNEKSLSEIAILTRSNAELEEFAEMLKLKNIPYELKDGKDIFSIPAVNILYFYMQFLINPNMHSFRIFQLLLAQPFNIDSKDYQILFEEVSKERTFIDVLRNIDKSNLKDKFTDYDKLKRFLETYDYLTEYKTKENIKNTILEIGSKTGIFDYYLNTDINKTENIAGLKRFIDEAAGFSEIYKTSFLEEFYTYLQAIINDDEKITTDKAPVNMNAVQLCTYHGSKGREFEYVYMPTLINLKWESSSKSLKPDIPLDISEYLSEDDIKEKVKPSDLRKLMYVAITRAKHTLRMSYPDKINGKDKKPTVFLAEIKDMFDTKSYEYDNETFWEQAENLLIKKDYDYKQEFETFINSRLENRNFSPSAINRYLACPRQYLYNDIFELTPKDGNPNALSYGIAIHKACEETVKYIIENQIPPDKSSVIGWFKKELSRQPMESYNQRLNYEGRGENALDDYYSQILNIPSYYPQEVEYKLNYTLDSGINFIGYIDRIDKNQDGTYTIYDYKTGNNKTSKIKINGEHEDYYNQMAWYKYFYEKSTGHKVSTCQFIYPEDFESKNNPIEYTENEINDAVNKFRQAIDDIKNYKFEPSYKENACQYCSYKDFCSMNVI